MNNFCGLDFGTSNSALGFFHDDKRVTLTTFDNKPLIPSSIFFDLDDGTFFGTRAVKRYIDGRDGRMMWSPKNALGTNLVYEKTQIGRETFAFTDIIGLIVDNIKNHAEAQAGRDLTDIVIGRPVFYNDKDPVLDASAQTAMETLLKNIGFKNIEFAYEPIAAARHYQQSITGETIALVVDMGGGTSDFTIARLKPVGHGDSDILSIGGVHVAGTNFDRRLSLKTVMPELGLNGRYQTLEGKWSTVPPTIHKDLATWHKIGFCYTKNNATYVKQKIYSSDEPHKFQRLLQTIEQRLGHHLAIAVEHAKIALTDEQTVKLSVHELTPALDVDITRTQFQEAIAEEVDKINATVVKTVADAGIDRSRIAAIFMTGGASMVPLVRTSITSALPHAVLVEGDKFGSVATGLALMAQEKFA